MNDTFDPARHIHPDQKWFEDFRLGERYIAPSRTMTEAVFAAFQTASMDNHPIHYDREYCKARGYPGLLAHGLQVLIQACPGASPLAHVMTDSLVAFLEQSSRFLAPTYDGDTLYPAFEITGLKPQRSTGVITARVTIHKQDGTLVMEGEQKLLVRKRQPAESRPAA